MNSQIMFVVMLLLAMLTNIKSQQGIQDINVVFIWFDDLGFGDTGYNGAEFPTPILDNLANNDAIKINFHYTEQVCSASRSALLTGRYAWLSGLNSIAGSDSNAAFNEDLPLFPEILSDKGWNTYIAGKWHVGYCNESLLPWNRGIQSGLVSKLGLQYYARGHSRSITELDQLFGTPSGYIRTLRRQYLGSDFQFQVHDTYRINNSEVSPAFVADGLSNDPQYIEDLYTEDIKSYIADQDGVDPFFLMYSQWTPHSFLTQPPETRPDGTSVDYSACYNAFPNRAIPTCDLDDDTRCVFCKQVHYASINIEEIIDEIKNNANLEWDDTVVIITSDNGAAQGGSGGGYSYGSPLPLRGRKSGVHEGGIRTPAIIKGGFVENTLSQNNNLVNNMFEYNEMVHISDWYHIIVNGLARITSSSSTDYNPDSDHSGLDLWRNIVCEIRDGANCDTRFPPRNEIISMRMCGDPDGNFDAGEKFFYSAYVRQGDWKLVVNGSNGVLQTCDSIQPVAQSNPPLLFSYLKADGDDFAFPDSEYFQDAYLERFNRMSNNDVAYTLYGSDCLVENFSTSPIVYANPLETNWHYNDQLLYEMPKDRVEACSINDTDKKQELLDILIARSTEYAVTQDAYIASKASFKASMDSYDCDAIYTKSWDGINEDDVDINDVWQDFIDKHIECYGSLDPTQSPTSAPDSSMVIVVDGAVVFAVATLLVFMALICGFVGCKRRRAGKWKSIEGESDVSDVSCDEDNVEEGDELLNIDL